MGVKLGLSHYGKNTFRIFENRVLRREFGQEGGIGGRLEKTT
jgi:hypothetical protein